MQISVENYLNNYFPSFSKLPSPIKTPLILFFKKFFNENEFNQFFEKNAHKDRFTFIESVLDYLNVNIYFNKKELERIPSYGKVVIIANHPLGALDALALLSMIQDIRKDIKIVANSFLSNIKNLEDLIIPVDNVNGKIDKKSLNTIYESLKNEEAVIFFPAGEVSRIKPNGVYEKSWKSGFLKIASKMRAPILPIYIKAKNSKSFYMISMINRALATATLPKEILKFKNKDIRFVIGKPISYESYEIPSLSQKEKLKLIKRHFEKIAKGKKGILKTQNPIALPEDKKEIKDELKDAKLLGLTNDGKKLYLYECEKESAVLKEIGRLREISFRIVGEGSGKKRDIDEYDFIYKHIIIWDENGLEIAGAYRIGVCKEILPTFGIEGLYTSTLFEFDEKFEDRFFNGLELGRSFVQPKYWNSRALDYLWQGIGAYIKNYPNIRYLFGPVSLSSSYTKEAKELIIFFYSHYFAPKERLVKHKNPYILSEDMINRCKNIFCLNDYKKDLKILKDKLSLLGFSIPTLYKQYSEICEEGGVEFLDFGIDKDFNNCIDGFIVTDLNLLKPIKRKRYIGEYNEKKMV